MIGATESDLEKIQVADLIIPGNDQTHAHATGEIAHRLIAGSENHDLWPGDLDIDLFPAEDWAAKEPEQAQDFHGISEAQPYFRIAATRRTAFARSINLLAVSDKARA